MKRFITRLCLFFLPVALLFLPVVWHLEKNRELASVATMATENSTAGRLIGLAYTDPMHLVKQEIIERIQPRVIALGSSRVLAFRSLYFTDPDRFYNCGRSVGKIRDLRAFLESYPGKTPDLILLGLDQDYFGGDAGAADSVPRDYSVVDTGYGSRVVKGTKAFYESFKDDGLVTGDPMPGTERFFGRNARLHYEGYRPDGSYLYGRTYQTEDNYLFASTIRRIDRAKGRFAPAERVDPAAVAELDGFLQLCSNAGIHVISFLPPYASAVYGRLLQEREKYPHVFSLHSELSPLFGERGYRLFDFSDLGYVGSNDFETYDGFHGSEVAYLKMIAVMAADDAVLRAELDLSLVGKLLSEPFSARQLVEEVDEAFPKAPSR